MEVVEPAKEVGMKSWLIFGDAISKHDIGDYLKITTRPVHQDGPGNK